MRKSPWLVLCCCLLAGSSTSVGQARQAPPNASFYGIGDLPGGATTSMVRDAIKIDGVIYAVGASAAFLLGGATDSAVIWRFDGVSPATLGRLPLDTSAGGGSIAASAITPDADFIASQAHYQVTGTNVTSGATVLLHRGQAVRVERDFSVGAAATMNLTQSPFPSYSSIVSLSGGQVVSAPAPSAAVAISHDGSILYGTVQQGDQRSVLANRAVRFDVINQTSMLIPLLNVGDTTNSPALHGTSSDGSVVVGFSQGGPAGLNGFRYVHGTPGTVTAIPRLPGGTSNRAVAVSPDGNLTLAVGSSTHSVLPQTEVYIHNATSGAITRLGSPNTAWTATGAGGMTVDGSVVAFSFAAPTCVPAGSCAPARYGYIRNGRGWFRLESILAAEGVFLPNLDWHDLQINGISADGTLVFGQGIHGENLEGFVAEFAADYLKTFDVPAQPTADTSIVGAWVFPEPGQDPTIVMFLPDGTYFEIETTALGPENAVGFERGRYRRDPTTHAFSVDTLVDTNGASGLSGLNGVDGTTFTISGNDATIAFPSTLCGNTPADPCSIAGTRVTIGPDSPVGPWYGGNPSVSDGSVVFLFLDDGTYYFAQDGDSSPAGDPNGVDGIEKGTWQWNALTGVFSTVTTVDTNREWGFNAQFPLPGSQAELVVRLSPDQLRATATIEGNGSFILNRVAVASALTASGSNVVVQPTSGTGTTPVTVAFSAVTAAGETTLEVIDPSAVGSPAPPAGFSLGDPPLYYELDTTASFDGAVSVCFSYAGISFGTSTPRLFHFEDGAWTDITSTVDTVNTMICGVTTSFSPFALFISPVALTGFYAPVSQSPGVINSVKGGSTVPLKFNIHVNGVEQTDPAGVQFGVWRTGCADLSVEDPVDFTTAGNTELRYAGGSFIQNWKTPSTPGCYLVRTTVGGLSLSALFRVK